MLRETFSVGINGDLAFIGRISGGVDIMFDLEGNVAVVVISDVGAGTPNLSFGVHGTGTTVCLPAYCPCCCRAYLRYHTFWPWHSTVPIPNLFHALYRFSPNPILLFRILTAIPTTAASGAISSKTLSLITTAMPKKT